jgi:hypothetical protein
MNQQWVFIVYFDDSYHAAYHRYQNNLIYAEIDKIIALLDLGNASQQYWRSAMRLLLTKV